MTTPDASATPPARRITVEDIERALDFVLSLTIALPDDSALLRGDGQTDRLPLPLIAQIARETRDLYWAPEAYRPHQEVDLHRQEFEHAARVLSALARGDEQ